MSLLAEIHAHATERPDAIAIAERGRPALSYRALVEAAAALAARLRAEGVGPEQVVALAMEKSTEWVIGALAAWWCGAAWMPLDPGLPAVRRRRLLRVADAKMALVSPRTDHLEALPRAIPVTLERGEGAAPFARVPADTLAYVIFSSGSTGAPKGIAVTWAGLPSMLAAQREAFSLGAGDHCLWVLSTSFDASISDVFTALGAGASLHIEPPARTPTALVEQLARCAITHVDLPPAMLAKMSPDDAPQTLRTVIIGGEVCPAEAVRRWAARVRLVNVYGPTEATVCTSLARCDPNAEHGARIGRPLPGVIYRLVEGELWIGGGQVARGYLGEGPADRFVEREGERYFRTGDRVSRDVAEPVTRHALLLGLGQPGDARLAVHQQGVVEPRHLGVLRLPGQRLRVERLGALDLRSDQFEPVELTVIVGHLSFLPLSRLLGFTPWSNGLRENRHA